MATKPCLWLLAVFALGCGSSEKNQAHSGSGGRSAGGAGSAGTSAGSGSAGTGEGGSNHGGSSNGGSNGGGSSAGTSSGPPPTESLRYACREYVRAACERREECTGLAPAGCMSFQSLCPDYLFSEGSSRTRESVLSCAEVHRTQPCEEVIAGVPPTCATDGTLPPGSGCAFTSQCAGECLAPSGNCGKCAPRAELGGACGEEMGCQRTQVCEGTQCVDEPFPVDASRLPGGECEYACTTGYVCARAAASAPATCLPEPATGEPCYYEEYDGGLGSTGQCSLSSYCDADFTCKPLPEPGEPCAPEVPARARCRFGACVDGTCEVVDTPGMACNTSGPSCGGRTTCRCPAEDTTCAEGTCVYDREEAESCTGPNDRCADGTVCTSGRCVATDELTVAARCD